MAVGSNERRLCGDRNRLPLAADSQAKILPHGLSRQQLEALRRYGLEPLFPGFHLVGAGEQLEGRVGPDLIGNHSNLGSRIRVDDGDLRAGHDSPIRV